MTPRRVRSFVESSGVERVREVLDPLQKLKNLADRKLQK